MAESIEAPMDKKLDFSGFRDPDKVNDSDLRSILYQRRITTIENMVFDVFGTYKHGESKRETKSSRKLY